MVSLVSRKRVLHAFSRNSAGLVLIPHEEHCIYLFFYFSKTRHARLLTQIGEERKDNLQQIWVFCI